MSSLLYIPAFLVLFFGVLIQIYLGKYSPQSSCYWRNIPFLASIVFELMRNALLDLAVSAIHCLIVVANFEVKQWITLFFHIPSLFRLAIVFRHLDNAVDTSLPHEVLAHSVVQLGSQLSPFLRHFLREDDLHDLNRLVSVKLITQSELYSFCNLLAFKLYQQALLTLDYEHQSIPEEKALIRAKIAHENMEAMGCYVTFVIHLFKKDPRILAIVSSEKLNELTFQKLAEVYPVTMKAGKLLQVLHDIPEFRLDLRHESTIGKISANYFLAQLEKNNMLVNAQEKLSQLPERAVNFYELPEEVCATCLQIQREVARDAFDISLLAGWIYTLSLEYKYRIGFLWNKPSWKKTLWKKFERIRTHKSHPASQ